MNADEALRTHFQAEVPQPWPACRALAAQPATTTRLPGRAILALAAAVLLGVGLWLSGGEHGTPKHQAKDTKNLLNTATADGKSLLQPTPMDEKP
jgi:hypothetical protein